MGLVIESIGNVLHLFRERHQCEWGQGAKEAFQESVATEPCVCIFVAKTLKHELE